MDCAGRPSSVHTGVDTLCEDREVAGGVQAVVNRGVCVCVCVCGDGLLLGCVFPDAAWRLPSCLCNMDGFEAAPAWVAGVLVL